MKNTMTDDRLNLHRVDTSQLAPDDGVSVGGCCSGDCNEGRDCPVQYAGDEPYSALSMVVAIALVCALAVVVWYATPELRGLVSIIVY
jgi:hypothetical protein